MPDNSAKIAELEDILNSGATEVVTDGQRTLFDHEQIRRRVRELKAADTTGAYRKRPRAASIDLSGF